MTPVTRTHNPCHRERIEGAVVRRQPPKSREIVCALPILVLALNTQTLHAQARPWNVDRICGRVEHLKKIPERKHPDSYSEKRRSLKAVPLELYKSDGNQPCCDGLKTVGSLASGKNGEFEFKPEKPGHYWLTAKWSEKDYYIDVDYAPQANSSTICSQQGIDIEDDGSASWWITVTVDSR